MTRREGREGRRGSSEGGAVVVVVVVWAISGESSAFPSRPRSPPPPPPPCRESSTEVLPQGLAARSPSPLPANGDAGALLLLLLLALLPSLNQCPEWCACACASCAAVTPAAAAAIASLGPMLLPPLRRSASTSWSSRAASLKCPLWNTSCRRDESVAKNPGGRWTGAGDGACSPAEAAASAPCGCRRTSATRRVKSNLLVGPKGDDGAAAMSLLLLLESSGDADDDEDAGEDGAVGAVAPAAALAWLSPSPPVTAAAAAAAVEVGAASAAPTPSGNGMLPPPPPPMSPEAAATLGAPDAGRLTGVVAAALLRRVGNCDVCDLAAANAAAAAATAAFVRPRLGRSSSHCDPSRRMETRRRGGRDRDNAAAAATAASVTSRSSRLLPLVLMPFAAVGDAEAALPLDVPPLRGEDGSSCDGDGCLEPLRMLVRCRRNTWCTAARFFITFSRFSRHSRTGSTRTMPVSRFIEITS